jgi:four helix bundle protein
MVNCEWESYRRNYRYQPPDNHKTYTMFLQLNHQKLEVYKVSRQFVFECYKLTKSLPPDERFGMISQIRRAALSVHLNVAEGASRKSENERKRYYEIARGSVIEIDAALDIANNLEYLKAIDTTSLGKAMIDCFRLLTGMIKSGSKN